MDPPELLSELRHHAHLDVRERTRGDLDSRWNVRRDDLDSRRSPGLDALASALARVAGRHPWIREEFELFVAFLRSSSFWGRRRLRKNRLTAAATAPRASRPSCPGHRRAWRWCRPNT